MIRDFGPIRLVLPPINRALEISAVLQDLRVRLAEQAKTQGQHAAIVFAGGSLAARLAGILSCETDANGEPQDWGNQFRGRFDMVRAGSTTPEDLNDLALIVDAFLVMGAGYESLYELLKEIQSWLDEEIVRPISQGEKLSGFFAKRPVQQIEH